MINIIGKEQRQAYCSCVDNRISWQGVYLDYANTHE